MPRKKQLEAIRERYRKSHANAETAQIDAGGVSSPVLRSSDQDTPLGEQGYQRYTEGYSGRDNQGLRGTESRQGLDRELHRGDGLVDRPLKPRNRSANQDSQDTDELSGTEPGTAVTADRPKRIRLPRLTPVRKDSDNPSSKPKRQPLTRREAEDLRDKLTMAYIHIFRGADDVIRVTNGSHEFIPIWSAIDDDDIAILVNRRLDAAQKSSIEAKVVLAIISAWERFAVMSILIPRFYRTYEVYMEYGFDIPRPRTRRRRHRGEQERKDSRTDARGTETRREYSNGYQATTVSQPETTE